MEVGGAVYIGSGDGNVYALNAYSGAKLWSFSTGGAVESSPALGVRQRP
jgi:outer membrane protein assembly factor BamB